MCDKHGHVLIQLYLNTLDFECHTIFQYHKIIYFKIFSSPLKTLKTIISSLAVEEWVGGFGSQAIVCQTLI